MNLLTDTLAGWGWRLRAGEVSAVELVQSALDAAEACAGSRAFLSLNPHAVREAQAADANPPGEDDERPLHGMPISVKDIFDVAGMETTYGSSFPARLTGPAKADAAFVAAFRRAGAIIIGKTHLNEFAYGLTGENETFGPCTQPRDPAQLTGGSSSGAAASVQGGAALAGLGTDTGGSIRVPAALCGLTGFRHSPDAAKNAGLFPLAPSFDTCGWVQRNLGDLALVFRAIAGPPVSQPLTSTRIAFLAGEWLSPCEEPIRRAMDSLFQFLHQAGAKVAWHEVRNFERCPEIFSAVQAHEAARVHAPCLDRPDLHYDPVIRERLERGRALTETELTPIRREWENHCRELDRLWQDYDFLLAPACPLTRLLAGADHGPHRRHLLQLTTPFSLAGLPALTFPWAPACPAFGWQIVGRRGQDAALAGLGQQLAAIL